MGRVVAARAAEPAGITIREADFAADFASLRAVRSAVFIDEQRVPKELEFDERDALCIHLIAFDGATPVGTARLDVDYAGKVGRMAVLASHRTRGIGAALMARIHELARARGLRTLWCHAQLSAAPFYARLGYVASGPVFEEAGIEHVRMDFALR